MSCSDNLFKLIPLSEISSNGLQYLNKNRIICVSFRFRFDASIQCRVRVFVAIDFLLFFFVCSAIIFANTNTVHISHCSSERVNVEAEIELWRRN